MSKIFDVKTIVYSIRSNELLSCDSPYGKFWNFFEDAFRIVKNSNADDFFVRIEISDSQSIPLSFFEDFVPYFYKNFDDDTIRIHGYSDADIEHLFVDVLELKKKEEDIYLDISFGDDRFISYGFLSRSLKIV